MVERICPACQHGNPLENSFCGRCGQSLERQLPATQSAAPLTIAGRELPVTWKQVGQTMAVGLTALVAEAGMAWLRRKVEQANVPAAPRASATRPAPTNAIVHVAKQPESLANDIVTVMSQRVVEVWEHGTLTRQVVERTLWRKERT